MSIEQGNIRRVALAVGALAVAIAAGPSVAWADGTARVPGERSSYTAAPLGVAIVALAGASEGAWPLAASVYATPSLRPPAIDDAKARVLCGEAPLPDAPADLRDLGQMVNAVTGDDAPSRALLGDLARRFNVRALVVVRTEGGGPRARVFLPDQAAFDAASYAPDGAAPPWSWSGAARSLDRAFGASPRVSVALPAAQGPALQEPNAAPSLAIPEGNAAANAANAANSNDAKTKTKDDGQKARPFYLSGWFWGAVGAAAFAGAAIFLATRDSSPSTIHLQIEVSH